MRSRHYQHHQLLPFHFLSPQSSVPISSPLQKPPIFFLPKMSKSHLNFFSSFALILHSLSSKTLLQEVILFSFPLQNPLSINLRIPSNPTNAAALQRAAIVWFRNDLKVHDNECLTTANNESLSILPLYCFDPKDYGKSSTRFDKTDPFRASFLIESVNDFRKSLKARGSYLVVRIGKPENVLVEMAKAIMADAVYLPQEVSNAEAKSKGKIEVAMKEEGVEVKYFWGSTLYHLEDLPFKLEEMPTTYDGFKEKVQGLKAIAVIVALD